MPCFSFLLVESLSLLNHLKKQLWIIFVYKLVAEKRLFLFVFFSSLFCLADFVPLLFISVNDLKKKTKKKEFIRSYCFFHVERNPPYLSLFSILSLIISNRLCVCVCVCVLIQPRKVDAKAPNVLSNYAQRGCWGRDRWRRRRGNRRSFDLIIILLLLLRNPSDVNSPSAHPLLSFQR